MSSIHLKNRPTNRLLSFEQRKASCLLPLTEALLSSPQQFLSAMCRSSHALAPLQPRGQVVSPLRSADHVHRRPHESQWLRASVGRWAPTSGTRRGPIHTRNAASQPAGVAECALSSVMVVHAGPGVRRRAYRPAQPKATECADCGAGGGKSWRRCAGADAGRCSVAATADLARGEGSSVDQ